MTGEGRSLADQGGRKHVEQHLELERKQNRGCQHISMTRGRREREPENRFLGTVISLSCCFLIRPLHKESAGKGFGKERRSWYSHGLQTLAKPLLFFYHLRHAHTKIQ